MNDIQSLDSNDPLTKAQYQQLQTLEDFEASGEVVGGWKLGLTSGASRDAFGPDIRPFGFILGSRMLRSGASLWWDSKVAKGSIENELCFEIGSTITEPVTAETVIDALKGVAPAFEINQVRIDSAATNEERLADNLSNWGLVSGEFCAIPADWQQSALKVRLLHNADGVESVAADGHIDDHFVSLARLANRLLQFGRKLEAGQRVITGAFGRVIEPRQGLWSGDFGDFGRVHVRIER